MGWVMRCRDCGKFMRPESGASWVMVPGIDVPGWESGEEWERCKTCTREFGPATPRRIGVRVEMCSGVYK